jgi:hypothetical protein
VVGIEGHNPSGHCFVASKLIYSIPVSVDAQLPSANKQAIDNESNQNSDAGTLSRELSSVSFLSVFLFKIMLHQTYLFNEQLLYFVQA